MVAAESNIPGVPAQFYVVGLYLYSFALVALVLSPVSNKLDRRAGAKAILFGVLFTAASIMVWATVPDFVWAGIMVCFGVGYSLFGLLAVIRSAHRLNPPVNPNTN